MEYLAEYLLNDRIFAKSKVQMMKKMPNIT